MKFKFRPFDLNVDQFEKGFKNLNLNTYEDSAHQRT